MSKKYYITTPIYYPSNNLHLGHTYTTIAADVLKRIKKLEGYDVFFTTGTDEHGQKIEEAAKKYGSEPLAYVTNIVNSAKDLWKKLDIDYDAFRRTTDKEHTEAVSKIFQKLYDNGDIYKSTYKEIIVFLVKLILLMLSLMMEGVQIAERKFLTRKKSHIFSDFLSIGKEFLNFMRIIQILLDLSQVERK